MGAQVGLVFIVKSNTALLQYQLRGEVSTTKGLAQAYLRAKAPQIHVTSPETWMLPGTFRMQPCGNDSFSLPMAGHAAPLNYEVLYLCKGGVPALEGKANN